MYIYKVLKENRHIYIGITGDMHQRMLQHKTQSSWWLRKDKIIYTDVGNKHTAEMYEDLLINLYLPEYNVSKKGLVNLKSGTFSDNFNYYEYIETSPELLVTHKVTLDLELRRKKRKLSMRKNVRTKLVKDVKKEIGIIYNLKEIDIKYFKVVPMIFRNLKKDEKHSVLKDLYIITPLEYSVSGIKAIKKFYLKLFKEEEKTNLTIEDLNYIRDTFGDFRIYYRYIYHCDNPDCGSRPFLTTPCSFSHSLNNEDFSKKTGFALYDTSDYFKILNYRYYCLDCYPDTLKKHEINLELERLRFIEIENRRLKKEAELKIIRESNLVIFSESSSYWESEILLLSIETKQILLDSMKTVYTNMIENPVIAEKAIELVYKLGFAKKIPEHLKDNRPFKKGIFYVGDYYYDSYFSHTLKRLKYKKASN